jgi:hypothetical protein
MSCITHTPSINNFFILLLFLLINTDINRDVCCHDTFAVR